MARISEKFASKFLKTENHDKNGTVYTILRVLEEEIGRSRDDKLVMFFKETDDGFPLNRINAETLAEAFGDDTDEWEGQQCLIRREVTEFEGKRTPCLRAYPADQVSEEE